MKSSHKNIDTVLDFQPPSFRSSESENEKYVDLSDLLFSVLKLKDLKITAIGGKPIKRD